MNDGRQIAAESRQKFHKLPFQTLKILNRCSPIFFTQCRLIIADRLTVVERQSKERRQSILTSAKAPKFNWLP